MNIVKYLFLLILFFSINFLTIKCSHHSSTDSVPLTLSSTLSFDSDNLSLARFNNHVDPNVELEEENEEVVSLSSIVIDDFTTFPKHEESGQQVAQSCAKARLTDAKLKEFIEEKQTEEFKRYYNDTYKTVLFYKYLDCLMYRIFYVGVFRPDLRQDCTDAFSRLQRFNDISNPRTRRKNIDNFKAQDKYSNLLSEYLSLCPKDENHKSKLS